MSNRVEGGSALPKCRSSLNMVHTGVRDRKGSVGISIYSHIQKKTEEPAWSRKLYHIKYWAMLWCQKSVQVGPRQCWVWSLRKRTERGRQRVKAQPSGLGAGKTPILRVCYRRQRAMRSPLAVDGVHIVRSGKAGNSSTWMLHEYPRLACAHLVLGLVHSTNIY